MTPGKTWRRGHCMRGKVKRSYTVDPVSGCHVWDHGKTAAGYGRTTQDGKDVYAHRFYWEQTYGPVPEGLELDHLCRNRACCNPDHLEPVTHKVNMERSAPAQRTHCPHGHEYTPENTYIQRTQPTRRCLTCLRERNRQYKVKKKQELAA